MYKKEAPLHYEKEEPHLMTHPILTGLAAQDSHTEGQKVEEEEKEEEKEKEVHL